MWRAAAGGLPISSNLCTVETALNNAGPVICNTGNMRLAKGLRPQAYRFDPDGGMINLVDYVSFSQNFGK